MYGKELGELSLAKQERRAKLYRIERANETGSISILVGVAGSSGIRWHPLPHCNLHSPTGFEVGYSGSGPADTAASILADYFGEERTVVERAWRGRGPTRPSVAVKLHQVFKFEVIATIQLETGNSYTLDESTIAAWLLQKHPEYLNPLASVHCPACDETLWREPDIYGTVETWDQAVHEFNLEHANHLA